MFVLFGCLINSDSEIYICCLDTNSFNSESLKFISESLFKSLEASLLQRVYEHIDKILMWNYIYDDEHKLSLFWLGHQLML